MARKLIAFLRQSSITNVERREVFQSTRFVITVGTSGPGLLTLYTDLFTLTLGVFRRDQHVYFSGPVPSDASCHSGCRAGDSTHCFHGWLWGRATEAYDMCLEYYGLGPVAMVCWLP